MFNFVQRRSEQELQIQQYSRKPCWTSAHPNPSKQLNHRGDQENEKVFNVNFQRSGLVCRLQSSNVSLKLRSSTKQEMVSWHLQYIQSIPERKRDRRRGAQGVWCRVKSSKLRWTMQSSVMPRDSIRVPGLAGQETHDDTYAYMGTLGRRQETKKQEDTKLRETQEISCLFYELVQQQPGYQ